MTRTEDEAFGAELTKAMPRLQAPAHALTRNRADAADLVQQTLLKAWRCRGQFHAGTNLQAWLMCIMRNTRLSELRVKGRETPEGLYDYASGLSAPASQEWSAAAGQVGRAIAAMTAEQAEALVQVGALGESYDAVASRSGCPEGTMKSRVCRARRMLRARVDLGHLFEDAHPAVG
jgi:RNA polymerase sigma-70 factor (ECF subfamily)